MDTTSDMQFADIPSDKNAFAVMGVNGDTKTIWDPNVPAEVDGAREQFALLRKKGYAAYRVTGKDGEKGEVMHEFDPKAGRVIFALPMVGG